MGLVHSDWVSLDSGIQAPGPRLWHMLGLDQLREFFILLGPATIQSLPFIWQMARVQESKWKQSATRGLSLGLSHYLSPTTHWQIAGSSSTQLQQGKNSKSHGKRRGYIELYLCVIIANNDSSYQEVNGLMVSILENSWTTLCLFLWSLYAQILNTTIQLLIPHSFQVKTRKFAGGEGREHLLYRGSFFLGICLWICIIRSEKCLGFVSVTKYLLENR